MKRLQVSKLAAFAVIVAVSPYTSHAIVWGELDGERHPNVGSIFLRFDPEVFTLHHDFPGVPPGVLPVCSGSLVARNGARGLFLTAGHCVQALIGNMQGLAMLNPEAVVSFSTDQHADLGATIPIDMESVHWELSSLPPALGRLKDRVDIGMLVLQAEQAVDLPEPVMVAAVGPSPPLLDALGRPGLYRSEFRVVGFGDDVSEPRPHTRTFSWGIREVGYPRAVNLSDEWLMAQQHGPSGSSGVYFGDSGGPVFWFDTTTGEEIVVAVVGFGVGTEFTSTLAQHYRVDTLKALAFIDAVKVVEGF